MTVTASALEDEAAKAYLLSHRCVARRDVRITASEIKQGAVDGIIFGPKVIDLGGCYRRGA